jgi:tRNA A37 methylthiotransferase MiaB
MNRTYRAADYRTVVERISRRVSPVALGADVIVGFPGESDADFEETRRFIESLPFAYLHVFPWSPRPGTRAASLPGRIPGPVVDARSAVLRDLSRRKGEAFARGFVGRTMQVLVEEPAGAGEWSGLSEHYVRVTFPWPGEDDLTNVFHDVAGRSVDERDRHHGVSRGVIGEVAAAGAGSKDRGPAVFAAGPRSHNRTGSAGQGAL